MLRELVNRPKFVFNALFSLKNVKKEEVVTAFSGLLELSRRSKSNYKPRKPIWRYFCRKNKNGQV